MNKLNTLLSESAEKFPHKIALVIDEEHYTYQELNDLVHRLASALSQQGVIQGECVAFLLPNSLAMILCYYACFSIGAIAVPINIQFNNEMIEYALKQSNPPVFITTSLFYKRLLNEKILEEIKQCYLISEAINYPGVKDFQELLSTTVSITQPEIELDKPALIYFTSGTTGLPKAVVHSHHGLCQGTKNQIAQIHINHDDNTLVMFPICYLIGLGSQILPFHDVGATVVLLSQFEPKEALAKLHSHQITKIYGFPKLYLELINNAESMGVKVNTLNFCFSGGEAIAISLQEQFKSLFDIEITEGCGMSELQIYCMNPCYEKKKTGAIGFPIVNMEMQLIDEQGKVIATAHQTGEIRVRGGSMCTGYWHDSSLTQKTIKKGWFHTGDLAYRDNEGCYWFVSRKADIIHRGEELISPLTIENIFYQHHSVKEAAAIALPNPNKVNEDAIVVYLVLKDNKITPSALMDFAGGLLPPSQHPQQIIILKQLPYGFTGKIDRRTLRSRTANDL